MFNLIINPSFDCKANCEFCMNFSQVGRYRGKLLDLNNLENVFKTYDIRHVEIGGGEPTDCDYLYMIDLINKIREFYNGEIDIKTNFSKPDYCLKFQSATNINLVVGYNFHLRPNSDSVWFAMYDYTKPFDIEVCATPHMIKAYHPNLILKKFAVLNNLKGLEIVRYQKNMKNQWDVSNELYETYMKMYIDSGINWQGKLKNVEKVKDNSFLNRDLILNPDGLLYTYEYGTIIDYIPYNGKVPAAPEEFKTYTNNLVNYIRNK